MSITDNDLKEKVLTAFKDVEGQVMNLHIPRRDKDSFLKKINAVQEYIRETARTVDIQIQHDAILPSYKGLLNTLKAASKDPLTSLPQRSSFEPTYEHVLQRINDGKIGGATIITVDANDFKTVNEYFGHSVGDAALQAYANIMRAELPESDYVARFGGDEFLIIIEHRDPKSENETNVNWVNPRATETLDRINDRLRNAILEADMPGAPKTRVPLGLSFGTFTVDPRLSREQNYKNSDINLFENKAKKEDIYAEIREKFDTIPERTKKASIFEAQQNIPTLEIS